MTSTIVTTTINPPTKAIQLYDSFDDWDLIVIGDIKTPQDYRLVNGTYVTPQEQDDYDHDLSDAIGWNCIQRRNIGIAMAFERGAERVALIDDDNIPLTNWRDNITVGKEIAVTSYTTDLEAFDPVGATNYSHLWHRGYPLELLSQRDYTNKSSARVTVDIQASFWNGDPDVDAICRLEHAPECDFDSSTFPIHSGTCAPFNSQNTVIARSVLPFYFLYPYIGRMDDIWASYYVQALGYSVVFTAPTVYQERNEHNLLADFDAELIGYRNNLQLLRDLARDPEAIVSYLPGKSLRAWDLYRRHFRDA